MSQRSPLNGSHCWFAPVVVTCRTMNAKLSVLLLAALSALPARAADERVEVRDLPAPVQKSLDRWRADGPVKQATRQQVDGRTVYTIDIEKNNAPNPRIRIAADGTIISDPVITTTMDGVPLLVDEYAGVVGSKASLSDLPADVQAAARSAAAGREIADIDRETWNGRTVYEIEFKERGLNSRIHLGEDGRIVRDERRPGEQVKSLFMGTQLEDTPAAVQETIRRVAGGREIADIDRKGAANAPVYRVEIKSGADVQELRIAEDGRILHDSRATAERRG